MIHHDQHLEDEPPACLLFSLSTIGNLFMKSLTMPLPRLHIKRKPTAIIRVQLVEIIKVSDDELVAVL